MPEETQFRSDLSSKNCRSNLFPEESVRTFLFFIANDWRLLKIDEYPEPR